MFDPPTKLNSKDASDNSTHQTVEGTDEDAPNMGCTLIEHIAPTLLRQQNGIDHMYHAVGGADVRRNHRCVIDLYA